MTGPEAFIHPSLRQCYAVINGADIMRHGIRPCLPLSESVGNEGTAEIMKNQIFVIVEQLELNAFDFNIMLDRSLKHKQV